ncbi:phage tail tip lysozyme [Rhodanobacter geophilus]|uniref:Phage tail tip lysozyme n=1 Tax=Rhodanobacter geophilus TaxID=3162488 RepID=A0ABV3QLD3_9GAMM
MTVVEALFITLGLDTRDFDKKRQDVDTSLTKLGETSDKQVKIIAESGKKAAHTFSLLKVEVLGALAAFGMGDGLKGFIAANMNGEAALGRMAANLGMSTQKLEAWKLAAREVGQSGQDATNALQSVAGGLAEAQLHGHSAFTQAARFYGVGIDLKSPEQTLINISKRLSEFHNRQQALKAAQELGVGDIFNLLIQGPDKLQQQLAHTTSLTGAATKESSEQAAKLQAQWADLQERFRQVGERIFAHLEPILERLGTKFANWLDSVDWGQIIKRIETFLDRVNEVVKSLGGWKTIAEVLGGVLALKLLAPLLQMVNVFGRLIPLIGTATTGAWGAMAGLGGAAGIALVALTGIAALHVDSLGGKKRADGTYEDEMPLPKNLKGPTNNELWARVQGRESTYRGTAMQAALLLAGRSYADTMSDADYRQMAQQILSGKMSPKDIGIGARPTSTGSPGGSKAIDYFMSQGFTRNQAIGMAANISAESAFNPYQYGDHGKAYGIGQWHADRQANFAKVMGLPIQASSYEQQLAFYAYEVKHNKPLMKAFGQDPNAGASAMLVSVLDERPKDAAGEAERRALLAQHMASGYGLTPAQAAYARGLVQPASVMRSAQAGAQAKGNTSNSVTIGTLQVNAPKATDAKGVAKGMQSAMVSHPLIGANVAGLT